jgi:hypothetical protein
MRKKTLAVSDVALRVLGGLTALGMLYVAIRSTPEMIRYLRMRNM